MKIIVRHEQYNIELAEAPSKSTEDDEVDFDEVILDTYKGKRQISASIYESIRPFHLYAYNKKNELLCEMSGYYENIGDFLHMSYIDTADAYNSEALKFHQFFGTQYLGLDELNWDNYNDTTRNDIVFYKNLRDLTEQNVMYISNIINYHKDNSVVKVMLKNIEGIMYKKYQFAPQTIIIPYKSNEFDDVFRCFGSNLRNGKYITFDGCWLESQIKWY